ncbi:MAG: hypothetical protein WC876_01415 [Candidatus Thermoplasmatota archaeon]|jgi:hypothetical protein
MAEQRTGQIIAWVAAGLLVAVLAMSFTGNGTWMGGIGMGWMMAVPLLLLALAIWAAYRYGRMEAKVEQAEGERRTR